MKVVVSGYFGFGNIGDETIKEVIKEELIKNNIEPIFLVKGKSLDNEINRNNLLDILRVLKKADAFISGGGGLLQDKTSSRSLIYYISLINLAQLLNKKTILFAQGIGPIYKKIDKTLVRVTLNKAHLITVRDEESKQVLLDCGVKKEIFVTNDLAFLYNPRLEKSEIFPYPYNVLQVKGNEKINIEELSDIARFMHYRTQFETIIVPFHEKLDMDIAKELNARTKFPIYLPKTIDDAFNVINNSNYVVGMRYHSVLFSLLLNKPVIPIYYDMKVRNLSNYFGLQGLEIEDLTLTKFTKVFLDYIKNFNSIQKKISLKIEDAKNDARKNFELLLQLLH